LREEFLRVIGMIAMFIFPVGVGLAAVADPAVRLMLGSKWLEAIPLIQIIAVYGTISALQSNIGQILFALGKPKVITLMSGGVLVLFFPALMVATHFYGATGAASMFLFFALATTPLVHGIFFRIAEMPLRSYFAVVWRPGVSAVLMGACVTTVRVAFSVEITTLPVAVELITCILIGVLSFLVFELIFWKISGSPQGAEKVIFSTLHGQIQKRFFKRPNR
jgi:O-antigen/teichoic acid export membrane protein